MTKLRISENWFRLHGKNCIFLPIKNFVFRVGSDIFSYIATEFGLCIPFHSHHTLGKLVTVTKSPDPVFDTKNIIVL